MMKKWLVVVMMFAMVVGMCSCAKKTNADQTVNTNFSPEQLLQEDGSYGWPGAVFGKGIAEIEKAIGVKFPEIPFSCEEWMDSTLPSHPELLFDYRNDNNYERVEYAAYNGEDPLVLNYGDFRGHVTFQFDAGELAYITIRFGQEAPIVDENMNYGGVSNDIDACFDQLKTDLEKTFGPCTREAKNMYMSDETRYVWVSDTEIGNGYHTRIELDHYRNEISPERDYTFILISRAEKEPAE